MNASFNNELQQLQMELRAQNFDLIRFSTYRTACKLRFIQKKFNFHLLDLLNVVEALREALTMLSSDPSSNSVTPIKRLTSSPTQSFLPHSNKFLTVHHLTTFLTSIYTNLNKRLPFAQQIAHVDKCVQSATAWFLYVYHTDDFLVSFNSFRVVLVLLCTGKLVEKLRHLFTSCFSTSLSNTLTYGQIDTLLHDMLALPYALQEISHSTYCANYAQALFAQSAISPITLDDFLDVLLYKSKSPNCLQWLVIFHRLISVDNVIHRVKCSACQRPSFSGFRYKCQQCHHRTYQLCQDCFWRGRTSEQHLSTHEMKEYTYFTPPNKDLRASIRKSLKCVPKSDRRQQFSSSLTIDKEHQSPKQRELSPYSKRLTFMADRSASNSPERTPARARSGEHRSAEKKLLISKLEAENRRILHEIKTLRAQLKHRSLDYIHGDDRDDHSFSTIEQEYSRTLPQRKSHARNEFARVLKRAGSVEVTNRDPYMEAQLQTLLTRKFQLESRIDHLRHSREELTTQLDHLGRILHASPRSTTASPHNRSNGTASRMQPQASSRSYTTPSTPIDHQFMNHLRTDLLLAADSLTSAMSTLVQHLNTQSTELDEYFYEPSDRIDDVDRVLYTSLLDPTV